MTALETVQEYVRAMETRDRNAVAATLAADVLHAFPTARPTEMAGIFEGRDEVLGYVDAVFGKFRSLVFVGKRWTVSADGRTVFLEARGDAVVAHSGAPYRNLYVMRFDIEAEGITRVVEYADGGLYMETGIPFTHVEIEAVAATPERAARLKPLG